MTSSSLIYPMFAMVLLTFGVLVMLFRTRARSVRDRKVKETYFSTYQGDTEPEASIKLARHFANIFETPTLFYVGCLAAMITGQDSAVFLLMAWMYVLLRALHAFIHTGSNNLRQRIAVYFSSWAVLLSMWVYLVVKAASNVT